MEIDYKDLFKKVENAIAVYTSEIDDSSEGASPEVLVQDRLKKGKERLDNAIEALALLCEPVEPPAGELEHIHYFCGNTEIPTDLEEREPRRAAFYKSTVALVRSYANLADELSEAGYSDGRIAEIKSQLSHYVKLRDTIRNAAGETLDLKPYEADMRHLIDTYIEADEARKISPFDNLGLLDLIVKTGIADAIASRLGGLAGNQGAVAETIENNVRKKINRDQLSDPAFYERMSQLLDEVIADRKAKAIAYEEYLNRIADIVKTVDAGKADDSPRQLDSPGKRAIYNVLQKFEQSGHRSGQVVESPASYNNGRDRDVDMALKVDTTVRRVRPDSWRGVQTKEEVIKGALYEILQDKALVETLFTVLVGQGEY